MIGVVFAYIMIAVTFGVGMLLASVAMLWLYTRPWFVRRMKRWSDQMSEMLIEDDLDEKVEIEQ